MMTLRNPAPIRFKSTEAGIAIGPILFLLAMLAVIAVAMTAGNGEFGKAGTIDRISANIFSQANLIRTKINECNMEGLAKGTSGVYPTSVDGNNDVIPTLVSALTCSVDPVGAQNIWTGARPAQLPPPDSAFNAWYYVNDYASGGGRCIYSAPIESNPQNDTALVAGLTNAAKKYTSNTANDGTSEVNYNPASSAKFVLWITEPSGTPNAHCMP